MLLKTEHGNVLPNATLKIPFKFIQFERWEPLLERVHRVRLRQVRIRLPTLTRGDVTRNSLAP